MADAPDRYRGLRGKRAGKRRNLAGVGKNLERPEQNQADAGGYERPAPRKQHAGHDDRQQVQRNKVAVLQPGYVDHSRDHRKVATELQPAMPRRIWYPTQQDEFDKAQGQPQNNDGQKEFAGGLAVRVLRPKDPYR